MTPSVMVGIESTCLAFLLVIFIAYIVLPRSQRLRKDFFFYCLAFLIVGIAADTGAWACELGAAPQWLQYGFNILCLVSSSFINAAFAYYVIALIREKKNISWNYARVIAIVNLCGTIAVIVGAITGTLFKIIPNAENPEIMIYESGNITYDIPNYLSSLSLLFLFVLILINAKVLGKKKIIVFSIYFVIPLLFAAMEIFSDQLQFSYAATGICMSVIYVMVQGNHFNELLVREKLLNEWSYVDSLTGLFNRRAYDRTLKSIKSKETIYVAFCDLNGLKKVNDEQGHQAGDQYLLGFSNIISKYFIHDFIYRISGDEFVVIARTVNEKDFSNCVNNLANEINANNSIASLGTAKGLGSDAKQVIKEAEAKMYEDKENYYSKHPDSSRRRTA